MTFKEYITKYNIKSDIRVLKCSGKSLTDLEGIESFIGLEGLNCSKNNLTDLNGIENLNSLIHLDWGDNSLTDLKDIENLTNLKYLICHNNQITSLKEIDKLKQLILLKSDITDNIGEARPLILSEIRIDKISDIE